MSTSPSWFDQEKFSRLVKKVGPKSAPEPPPASSQPAAIQPPTVEPPAQRPPARATQSMMTSQSVSLKGIRESMASSSSPIRAPRPTGDDLDSSLVVSEETRPHIRRTSPLPALKSLFKYEIPSEDPVTTSAQPSEEVSARAFPSSETIPAVAEENEEEEIPEVSTKAETRETSSSASFSHAAEDLAAAWEKITQLNEELGRAIQERDQARNEGILLREQLDMADGMNGPTEDISRLTQERDDALAEGITLREELYEARQTDEGQQAGELAQVTEERDEARREYADLREQFEYWKQDPSRGKDESDENPAESEEQLGELRRQLEDRDREVNAIKLKSLGMEDVVETFKQDLKNLQEQVAQTKDDASIAQRGLALSQKALQETREALREASENASMAKSHLESLKGECSTLVQQNMLLQAQHDQVSRELTATKTKLPKS